MQPTQDNATTVNPNNLDLIEVATYDRLRVLTTELRRVQSRGRGQRWQPGELEADGELGVFGNGRRSRWRSSR